MQQRSCQTVSGDLLSLNDAVLHLEVWTMDLIGLTLMHTSR